MSPAWPASLPQYVEVGGYQSALPKGWMETAMEAGPPRRDRKSRGGEAETIKCVIYLSDSEKATFDSFYTTTLGDGTGSFTWLDPIGRTPCSMEFVSPPAFRLRSGNLLVYNLDLRILP